VKFGAETNFRKTMFLKIQSEVLGITMTTVSDFGIVTILRINTSIYRGGQSRYRQDVNRLNGFLPLKDTLDTLLKQGVNEFGISNFYCQHVSTLNNLKLSIHNVIF
jgi:hypothetical protein